MRSPRITVSPAVLAWARRSAGLDAEQAAKRIAVSRATLEQWEAGTLAPTLVQLRNSAKVYRRPLAVLLLETPPNESGFDALTDYRAEGERPKNPSPELLAELRRAVGQREVMLELQSVSPDSLPPPRDLPRLSRRSTDIDEYGGELRSFAGVPLASQQAARDAGAALRLWISGVEAAGIIVIHTSGVKPAEMHGFSINEWPYPVIALNGSDQPRRRLFTLLHELAHLALERGGICDLHETESATPSDLSAIERRCNAIAAATLLPRDALLAESPSRSDWPLVELERLSRRFWVSSEAILLRLVSLGQATWKLYWKRRPDLDLAYEQARQRQRERNQNSSGGPSYYLVKARDIGHGYASSVLDAYRNDQISSLDVADYLNIRFSQLESLEAAVQ